MPGTRLHSKSSMPCCIRFLLLVLLQTFTCFDQILRQLLYAILAIAGMPSQVLVAYMCFMEHTCIHNALGDSYGVGHKHPCGIPQGCPLSMLFVSLLLRSCLVRITQFHAIARTLADDIMIMARGSRALHIIQAAFEATMEHIADIGGRLAPAKSCLSATTTAHKTWLATYVWTPIQQQIKVVHNLRDLGSALNSSAAPTTALSAARLEQAISAIVLSAERKKVSWR